ncbi:MULTISPECIES: SMI1/KNR4 family protein [Parachlamydia]|jgi:hypothetical protein|uniref:Knr4/Smi1-like domain-containing protein n=2 Tax=Parachlamydia acanthamoebae TaxID=83552 RepID=F8L246_PARAV|nr:SMI1/KNR4 family protein [Parachlamydia acanthamoebae]EFB41283.1 hypothetical protein pah_c047o057 [Parachlamydia acanthamoebae str. Hall's coccus]KIA76968.1 hypothetical protein DB43_HC00330 [Parachlamydia acanthamoebae]CCB87372.1 putative uncharacterized protein [Parachlamydia acanthamoebae UV-7]
MDHHIREFYSTTSDDESPKGCFHSVVALHDNPNATWEVISEQCSELCKGWFELSRLKPADRIEFIRDYWLSMLPYHPGLDKFLMKFFGMLDDIGVFIVQKKYDDPYEAHLVYSLRGNSGFYRGRSGISEANLAELQKIFPNQALPADYLAFLRIHDGFNKSSDCTGIAHSQKLSSLYEDFQNMLSQHEETLVSGKDTYVDPKSLIPFYESFGMPFYQCFWTEWYPENEMGNVYYSGMTNSISDITGPLSSMDNMAFSTFLDWLMFYLEQVEEPVADEGKGSSKA